MARKVRKKGSPSSSQPPISAPEWTIDRQWKHQHQKAVDTKDCA